jgi:hypothetical protein
MGKEQVPVIITPHDSQNRPINEGGIDIKVDILDSKGKALCSANNLIFHDKKLCRIAVC